MGKYKGKKIQDSPLSAPHHIFGYHFYLSSQESCLTTKKKQQQQIQAQLFICRDVYTAQLHVCTRERIILLSRPGKRKLIIKRILKSTQVDDENQQLEQGCS